MKYLGELGRQATGDEAAKVLHQYALRHLCDDRGRRVARLYRIFVYDAKPYEGKHHLPMSGESIEYGKTPTAKFRKAFHQALRGKRKVALRLGEVILVKPHWILTKQALDELKASQSQLQLEDRHFTIHLQQKGVDSRLAIDLTLLACKRLITQAVLITGDADFVPAAKVARREGVDVILDPLWSGIAPSLFEHIDGLQTRLPRPKNTNGSDPRQPSSSLNASSSAQNSEASQASSPGQQGELGDLAEGCFGGGE